MARHNGSAVADAEQQDEVLFPELDMEKPEHKKLVSLARKLSKKRGERSELLTTSKEGVDAAEQAVIAQMHELGLTKFRFGDVTTEIIPSKEKAEVKIEPSEEEDSDEQDDD